MFGIRGVSPNGLLMERIGWPWLVWKRMPEVIMGKILGYIE